MFTGWRTVILSKVEYLRPKAYHTMEHNQSWIGLPDLIIIEQRGFIVRKNGSQDPKKSFGTSFQEAWRNIPEFYIKNTRKLLKRVQVMWRRINVTSLNTNFQAHRTCACSVFTS